MINLSVFNVGRGSAVLIELPQREDGSLPVGIFDCFTGPGGKHPLLKALSELDEGVQGMLSIEFLVLSHMHLDHFLGVAPILRAFDSRVKLFADPGLDPRAVLVAEFPTDAVMDARARDEIKAIQSFKDRYPARIRTIASPGLTLYEDSALNLRIRSIAPCGTMLSEMTAYLRRYLQRTAKAAKSRMSADFSPAPPNPRRYNLNRSSAALEIGLGQRRVLLGGDVLSEIWSILLNGVQLDSDVVMLSHHGSGSGFPKQGLGVRQGSHVIASGYGYAQPSASVVGRCLASGARFWGTNVPERWRRLPPENSGSMYEYVRSVHYGNPATPADDSGDVRVSCSEHRIVTSGPEFFVAEA